MESHNIHSINELRRRRKELETEMAITRQAIYHSVKKTEYSTRNFVVKNLLIPLGAGGLASLIFNSTNWKEDERPAWVIFLQKVTDMVNQRFGSESNEQTAQQAAPTPPPEHTHSTS